MNKITEFKDEYRWLSNFSPVSIELDEIEYPSVEHAYMSAKSDNEYWKNYCSNKNNTAGEVKRASKTIILVDNWDEIKLSIMEECLMQKFTQEPYMTNLINTKNVEIEEGNRWGDKFWGICLKTNVGENNLGKLIMKIRKELKCFI